MQGFSGCSGGSGTSRNWTTTKSKWVQAEGINFRSLTRNNSTTNEWISNVTAAAGTNRAVIDNLTNSILTASTDARIDTFVISASLIT